MAADGPIRRPEHRRRRCANVNVTVNNPVTVNVTTTTVIAVTIGTAQVTDPTVRGDRDQRQPDLRRPAAGPLQPRLPDQTARVRDRLPRHERHDRAAKKKTTIGKATVTLKGGQSKKITVKLNAKGRKLLKKIKSFKATLTVTQSQNGKKPKTILKKSLRFKR